MQSHQRDHARRWKRTSGSNSPKSCSGPTCYLLYQLNPGTQRVSDFGDTSDNSAPMTNFAYILRRPKTPLLKWLYDPCSGFAGSGPRLRRRHRPSRTPGEPPPDLSVLFRDVGHRGFPAGFGPDDFCFIFRCGPFLQPSAFRPGRVLLSDRRRGFPGRGRPDRLLLRSLVPEVFIQPGGHNCILLDGNPESQRAGDLLYDVPAWQDHARITDFLDFEDGAFLSAELAPIYKGKFESLRRAVFTSNPARSFSSIPGRGPGRRAASTSVSTRRSKTTSGPRDKRHASAGAAAS